MIVLRAAVGSKKWSLKYRKPLAGSAQIPDPSAIDVPLQAIQIVAGMKIVDPVVFRCLTVEPRAVRILPRTTVGHGVFRQLKSLLVVGVTATRASNAAPSIFELWIELCALGT